MRIAVRNLRENNGKNNNQNNDHDDTSDDKNSFHFANSFLHFASLLQLVVSITRDRSGVFDRLFDSFDFLPLTIRLLSTLIKLIASAHLPGVQLKLLFPGTRCSLLEDSPPARANLCVFLQYPEVPIELVDCR